MLLLEAGRLNHIASLSEHEKNSRAKFDSCSIIKFYP